MKRSGSNKDERECLIGAKEGAGDTDVFVSKVRLITQCWAKLESQSERSADTCGLLQVDWPRRRGSLQLLLLVLERDGLGATAAARCAVDGTCRSSRSASALSPHSASDHAPAWITKLASDTHGTSSGQLPHTLATVSRAKSALETPLTISSVKLNRQHSHKLQLKKKPALSLSLTHACLQLQWTLTIQKPLSRFRSTHSSSSQLYHLLTILDSPCLVPYF